MEKTCTRCGVLQPLTVEFFKWLKPNATRKTARFGSWCRECDRQRSREYLKTHPDHRRSRDQAYRDRSREHLRAYARKYGKEYNKREVRKESMRKRNQADKLEALIAYGGSFCRCCGEDNVAFLTLDHINNDGAAHRRELGVGRGYLSAYKWAKNNNWPPIFQVLCFNCNCARAHHNGICPHELARQELMGITQVPPAYQAA